MEKEEEREEKGEKSVRSVKGGDMGKQNVELGAMNVEKWGM